jgi:hypothetical protein
MKQFYLFIRTLLTAIFIFGYSVFTVAQQSVSSGEVFSMIMLPDAQNYTSYLFGGTPSTFTAQTQWCVNYQVTRNIRYVGMVGDLTNESMSWEWENANNAMSKLDAVAPGIPFGVVPGNHDLIFGKSMFNSYFGVSRFQGRSYYGGHYGTTNEYHYDFISSGDLEFIVICLGSGDQIPGSAVLDWADALLKFYSYKRGIVINHSLMYPGIQASFTSPGQAIYNSLKDNPNLFLMVCGHEFGSGYRTDTYNGTIIYTMIADYQNESNGGNGWLRIAEFDPPNNVIHMTTYSPTLNSWKTGTNDQFDLIYNMQSTTIPLPVAYSVTGSGSYCQGTGGLPVGLSGSQTGVTYTLYNGGIAQSPAVSGTGNPISFGNQLAGTYTVSGVNITGTTNMTGSAVISENPSGGISVFVTTINANCAGEKGTATFTFTGGKAPYSVIIGSVTYSGTSPLSINLNGGASYSYTATDTYGCSQLAGSFSITVPSAITISGSVTDATCNVSNGAISITVTGGTLPVTSWKWTGPNSFTSTSQNISGLAAGTYSLTVTDSKTCTVTKSFIVQSGSSTILTSVSTLNNGTIFRTSPGYTSVDAVIYITGKSGNFGLSSQVKLTANASGGSGTYTYSWSPKTGLSATTGAVVTAKPSVTTTYTVTAKDSKGCTATQVKTVTVNKISCTNNRKSGVTMCVLNTNGTRSSTCVLLTNTTVLNNTNNLFGSCTATVASGVNTEFLSAEPVSNELNASIKAYPNPTNGYISLELTGFAEGKARINLYCTDGSLVLLKELELTGDEQIIALELSNLPDGVYLLQLVYNLGTIQTTIIKQ